MKSNKIFRYIATSLTLALTAYTSFFLVACLFIRKGDTQIKKVIYADNYEFFYHLFPVGIAGLGIGLLLKSDRSWGCILTIVGVNNSVSKVVSLGYWLSVVLLYLSFYYAR